MNFDLAVIGGGPGGYTAAEAAAKAGLSVVLIATGRRPAAGSLFIGAYRPDIEHGGILSDAAGRTSLPHLYVIGDARTGNIQLAHLAEAQGKNAVAAILGRPLPVDTSLVPACVYTDPEIASVGMTEAEARAAGIPVRCGKALSGANGRCVIAGTSAGFIKLVCRADTGRLLGAQLCWPRATDLIGELALAVQRGLTAADLAGLIHPPTPPLPMDSAPPQSRPRGLHETHVQAAADRTAGETFTREMRPLARIHDNYEKIILAAGRLTHNKSTCTGTASAVVPYRCFCCLQACAHSGRRRKATSCPLMSWACRQKKTRLLQSGRSSC